MATPEQSTAADLADQIADGFGTVTAEYKLLLGRYRQLEAQLTKAKEQYLKLLHQHNPDIATLQYRDFEKELRNDLPNLTPERQRWSDLFPHATFEEQKRLGGIIIRAEVACNAYKNQKDRADGVRIWNGPSADTKRSRVRSAAPKSTEPMILEQDFTTSGTPSRLGCPFAVKPTGNPLSTSGQQSVITPRSSISRASGHGGRRSKRSSFTDPIKAEICGNDPGSVSEAAIEDPTAAVCPIRFLDQHSPEEVAQYFENHKHELPRSHEVCIKRFQNNTESIRQLDAKYGNLASMIRGLGEKHQTWLPNEPADLEDEADEEDEDDPEVQESKGKVAKWAKAVSVSVQDGDAPDANAHPAPEEAGPEDRQSRFDRPLKEVRVGESPSRPWGISVPARYIRSPSPKSAATASPLQPETAAPPPPVQPRGCPFDPAKLRPNKTAATLSAQPNGCPIDHTKLQAEKAAPSPTLAQPKGCPFDHTKLQGSPPPPTHGKTADVVADRSTADQPKEPEPDSERDSTQVPDPAGATAGAKHVPPQMIFHGPVFIGYPPEQILTVLQAGFGERN